MKKIKIILVLILTVTTFVLTSCSAYVPTCSAYGETSRYQRNPDNWTK